MKSICCVTLAGGSAAFGVTIRPPAGFESPAEAGISCKPSPEPAVTNTSVTHVARMTSPGSANWEYAYETCSKRSANTISSKPGPRSSEEKGCSTCRLALLAERWRYESSRRRSGGKGGALSRKSRGRGLLHSLWHRYRTRSYIV